MPHPLELSRDILHIQDFRAAFSPFLSLADQVEEIGSRFSEARKQHGDSYEALSGLKQDRNREVDDFMRSLWGQVRELDAHYPPSQSEQDDLVLNILFALAYTQAPQTYLPGVQTQARHSPRDKGPFSDFAATSISITIKDPNDEEDPYKLSSTFPSLTLHMMATPLDKITPKEKPRIIGRLLKKVKPEITTETDDEFAVRSVLQVSAINNRMTRAHFKTSSVLLS